MSLHPLLGLLAGCGDKASEPYLVIDSIYVQDPPSGRPEATLIFLHGMAGLATDQLSKMHENMFFGDSLAERLRVVAPQVKKTEKNPLVEWFPFAANPWDYHTDPTSLATEKSLVEAANVINPIIDSEAGRFGGDYSKVFIFGYSKGGMIGSFLALTGSSNLGGVIIHSSSFPLIDNPTLSDIGRKVPIYHCNDPQDSIVLYSFAEWGFGAAKAAGAVNYNAIVHVNMSWDSHHGFSEESLRGAHEWILNRLLSDR